MMQEGHFTNCQVKVQQVSSKLETLLANSKIECRELYENQMEKITDAKKLADWIRDTYMRVKKSTWCVICKERVLR